MGNTLEQWRASIGASTWRNTLRAITISRHGYSCSWFQLLVLMVLLVIGGIEMNPGPIQSEMSAFRKTKGFSDMTGENYEWKISALLFLRALQKRQDFQIASNMEAAGKFDDVILSQGNCTLFLQLKHKNSPDAVLKLRDFARDKNFNLSKYLDSILDIKERWQNNPDLRQCGSFEKAKFVIYTNAGVCDGLVNTDDSIEPLSIVCTGGTCVCLAKLFHRLIKFKAVLSAAVASESVTDTPELWEVVYNLHNKQAQTLPSKRQLMEMLENLESLGDFTSYHQYISQVYLCTGQAIEKDLDDLIKNHFSIVFGTDSKLRDFKDGVQKWWRSSNCYLTVQTKFFQDIIHAITANIRSPNDNPEIKVDFTESACDILRQKLISGNKMLYIQTQCAKMSCAKVLQSFKNNLLVDVSTLQTHQTEVLALLRLGICDVLVVIGDKISLNMMRTLVKNPNSKCVVIISGKVEHGEFFPFVDTFCLSQLTLESQRTIMEREVVFQGLSVKLKSLADFSFLKRNLTADVVNQLHHSPQIALKMNYLDTCYLPRSFLRREYVTEEIFTEKHITLAITGMSEYRLENLVPSGEKVETFYPNLFKDYRSCRYILIDGEDEFTALSELNDNIHWLQVDEGGLHWKKSKGGVSCITKHLNEKWVFYRNAEELLNESRHMVLLVAEPGMGKSTEMCNITDMIKRKDPSIWVVRVDLNEYTTLLNQNLLGAVEFLERVGLLNTQFERRLFEHRLQTGRNVVIILDGFDEISSNSCNEIFDLLTKLSLNTFSKIILTARPVMTQKLQQKFSTLAFSMHAFTYDDQKNFLMRYWNQLSMISSELSNFICVLLQLVGTSLNNSLKEFTGIPLQVKILAEVFQEEAIHYSETREIRLPRSLDVLQLYDNFVDKKWEVYCRKLDVDVQSDMLKQLIDTQKIQLKQSHMYCAVFSYFDEKYLKRLHSYEDILKQNEDFNNRFNSGGEKIGIITHFVGTRAVFVHRNFTEYFVAKWFSKHLHLEFDSTKKLYFNENFEVVHKFLDRILAQDIKLHRAVLNGDICEAKNLLSTQNVDVNQKDIFGRTALHLAIMSYSSTEGNIKLSIIETLLQHSIDINCKDKLWHWRPLRHAVQIKAWSVVDKLLEKQADYKDLFIIRKYMTRQFFFENPLQVAKNRGYVQFLTSALKCGLSVQYKINYKLQQVMYSALSEGYVNLVEFILRRGVSVSHFITYGDDGHNIDHKRDNEHRFKTSMLHISAEYGRLKLVQLLIKQGADINRSCGRHCRTPIMWAAWSGDVHVTELLLNNGASVNETDEKGYTALFLAVIKGKNEVVELLLQNGANIELLESGVKRTPLMQAAERGQIQAVELLIRHGASANVMDAFGHNAFSIAVQNGRNEIVELLLKHTSYNVNEVDVLIWKAGAGDKEALKNIINNKLINAQDKQGYTALLVAARLGKIEVVKLLLQNGADVDVTEKYERTGLMQAAKYGHEQTAEVLIRHGASVNATNKYGRTALTYAVDYKHYGIVNLLLQHEANTDIFEVNLS